MPSGGPRRRARTEHGVVLPTRLMVASISVVAIGGLVFMATQPEDVEPPAATPVVAEPTPTSSATPTPTPKPKPKPKPQVNRSAVYVEVYNNSNIAGLAGQTSQKAQNVGWNVVGSDNWYGTIDATTVYFPPKLARAARLLAKDLGVTRTKPAVEPMRFDRLTLILTGPVG